MSRKAGGFGAICKFIGFLTLLTVAVLLAIPLTITSFGYWKGNFDPLKKLDRLPPGMYIVLSPDQLPPTEPQVPQSFHRGPGGQRVLGENAD